MALSDLRPSLYGADLRIGSDLNPLGNANNLGGNQGFYDLLYVRNLFVQDNLTIYDPDIDVSATSAARFGTADAYDFLLKSNNITRVQLTSAGVIYLVSATPAATATTTVGSDTFDRANESPATGWATCPGASGLQVSSNFACGQGSAQAINVAGFTAAGWGAAWDVQCDYFAALNAPATVQVGLATNIASAGVSAYIARMVRSAATSAQLDIQRVINAAGTGIVTLATSDGWPQAGTLRMISLVSGASAFVSALVNGALAAVGADILATHLVSGYGGAFFNNNANFPVSARIDNWTAQTTGAPPASAEDVVYQASAQFYTLAGTDSYTRWGRAYPGQLFLGDQADVLLSGAAHALSVQMSAFFGPLTYGTVRLLSAVGTPGLSGVVGLSGIGLTISAVGNDIAISAASLAASATFAVSAGIAVSALSATQWAATAASASASWFYPGTVDTPGLRPMADAASGTGMWSPGAGSIAWSTSGVERLRITSGGNIGIGTTIPNEKLTVRGNAKVEGILRIRSSSDVGNLDIIDAGAGIGVIDNSQNSFLTIDSAIRTTIDGTLHVLHTGNVGIGSASPDEKLTVVGNAKVDGILKIRNASDVGNLNVTDAGLGTAAIDNSINSFLTLDSGVRTIIDGTLHTLHTGNVGIGTATPREKLQIAGTFQISAVASATLPAASATRDGMIILDLTASAIVYYVNGMRLSAAVGGSF